MNLETKITADLWISVRTNYDKQDFTGAILDAFHFLSDLIRKKSGAEGDGAALIGSALGGAAPKIKLNKLQSESELNIQRGMETTLRGLYQTFRNPRSHEKYSDSEEDAQVIIIFIGYIVRQLDTAKSQFSREDFLKRVMDPDFFANSRYSDLLASEIPTGQLLEVFLDTYRAKTSGKIENLRYFFKSLLPKLNSDQLKQVNDVISDELKTADDEATIRHIVGSLGAACWEFIHETARLRIENRLIKSIKEGRYNTKQRRTLDGSLGTWAICIFSKMILKQELLRAIYASLSSNNTERENYIFKFILADLTNLSNMTPFGYDELFTKKIKEGDERFYNAILIGEFWSIQSKELEEAINTFTPALPTYDPFDDDIPF
ncbi:TIGR02391 family protein [Pseudomonas orientalis]|uniref:TIGR02391 family protein n=1 Tax=Pseudomonas orientalis TaxID=76758 RepID=UPI00320A6781